MAIPPANVLIANSSADWIKIGAPLVFEQDFRSSRYTAPVMVTDEANVGQAGSDRILRLKLEDRQGKIHVDASIIDAKTQKNISTDSADASSLANLIPTLDGLAKRIDSTAGPFSTQNTEALRIATNAASGRQPQERLALLKQALAADPNFALAYFFYLQLTSPAPPDVNQDVIAAAKSHMAAFPPYDRARLQNLILQLEHAPLDRRTAAIEKLVEIAPNDVDGLAMIGSLRLLNGDVAGGEAALNKAISLNPPNMRLKAQLVEGLVANKRFAEAEKILAAFDKNPSALAGLAVVILLEGDTQRATGVAEKYFATISTSDLQNLFRATWTELTGDHAKALSLAETTKFTNPQIGAMALAEATVWQMMRKDVAGAHKTAAMAAKLNSQPTPGPLSVVAGLLIADNETPAAWGKSVDDSTLNPGMKQSFKAYGFFLNGFYPDAAAAWKPVYEASQGADLRVRAMYGASLDRAGKTAEAQKVQVRPFLIQDFADLYGALGFSEMRRMTGLSH